MMNPFSLLKMKGDFSPAHFNELLSSVGIEGEICFVSKEHVPQVCNEVGQTIQDDEAKVFLIRGVTKGGERIEALFVMAPAKEMLTLVPPPKGQLVQ